VTTELHKVEGAGNDFLLGVGQWATRLSDDASLVRRLCDRRRGLGADGVIALTAVDQVTVRLTYRNSDGSAGAFCANATRCAARAAVEIFGLERRLVVETGWDRIPAVVGGREVTLDLPAPRAAPVRPDIAAPEGVTDLTLFDIGVPHLVAAVSVVATLDLVTLGPALRAHPALGFEGANVNFYEVGPDGVVAMRTWERGVEGETLACGSGTVAVALRVMESRRDRTVCVVPASGDRLTVEALAEPPVCPTRLTGPARMVAGIDLSADFLGES
jgi:diaminopimelate epimerase